MKGLTQWASYRAARVRARAYVGVAALSLGLGAWTGAAAQSLTWLGVLPGGNFSIATGVAADGSFVVGQATNANGQSRAFRW